MRPTQDVVAVCEAAAFQCVVEPHGSCATIKRGVQSTLLYNPHLLS
ncbi:hypothetical protein RR42_s2676 [Cupriavidus basilensis]|uniref:Uncharacterized protein n=1 Tax=Cupriavidus basilensis TaxID=68895 RepID=A0A0C4YML2_9BURK|nr:hypothetical protein RR42_s2676 [Cupriavidus basilensis]